MNSKSDLFSDETSSEQVSDDRSKSQITREREVLKGLGQQLINLSTRQLQQIELNDNTRAAILEIQGMKKGPLKRQLQYISSLLRHEDEAALQKRMNELSRPHQQQVRAHHQLEQWRDALVAGEDAVVTELHEHFGQLDRQHLMQLVRNARKELKLEKPPKSARAIFQYLKDLQSQE